jgi:hypothetical protein
MKVNSASCCFMFWTLTRCRPVMSRFIYPYKKIVVFYFGIIFIWKEFRNIGDKHGVVTYLNFSNYLKRFLIVLPCILISSKLFYQQMHSLLKHKMLQLTLKISLYMAPTCFGPFGPSSGNIRRNLAKVTVFVGLLVKIHR